MRLCPSPSVAGKIRNMKTSKKEIEKTIKEIWAAYKDDPSMEKTLISFLSTYLKRRFGETVRCLSFKTASLLEEDASGICRQLPVLRAPVHL